MAGLGYTLGTTTSPAPGSQRPCQIARLTSSAMIRSTSNWLASRTRAGARSTAKRDGVRAHPSVRVRTGTTRSCRSISSMSWIVLGRSERWRRTARGRSSQKCSLTRGVIAAPSGPKSSGSASPSAGLNISGSMPRPDLLPRSVAWSIGQSMRRPAWSQGFSSNGPTDGGRNTSLGSVTYVGSLKRFPLGESTINVETVERTSSVSSSMSPPTTTRSWAAPCR